MSASPFWTPADEAEFVCILDRFVEAAWEHKRCGRCSALNTWCPPMAAAFEAVVSWKRARELLSRAQYLRQREPA